MKIKKETLIKTIVAIIVPGGFIIWGAYEIGKKVGSGKKKQ